MKEKDENIVSNGYDYNLNLNQIGAMNAGLKGKINADEILIFESFIKYSTWNGCEKIVRGNEIYFYYHWEKVRERIPFLNLNSRTPIKNRFKKLTDLQLLKAHPNNESMSKSFYTFGALYDNYSNFHKSKSPSLTKDGTVPNQGRTIPNQGRSPYSTKDGTVLNQGRSPSLSRDAYDSTNDITNDITNEREKRDTKNEVYSHDVKNQIQQEKIFYDSPENRLKVWKMYQNYIESESFISHFEMSSEKYPNVEKTELMQTWVMRADWDSVKNVKINLIGNWIRIAEADFQKNKNKNGRSNHRLISQETANKVFTDRIRKLQEKDGY
jgi:hypothetical protein